MKKLIFVLIAALGMSCASYAQMSEKELKKATKEAQKIVKQARDEMENPEIPDKRHAKKLIDDAMKNPLIQDWDQTWYEAAIIYEHFFNQESIKSYQQGVVYDTVGMYNLLDQWFTFALRADSLQQIPNAKGKTSDEARRYLMPGVHRSLTTYINAGIFYFNHRHDNAAAFRMFDNYFTVAQNPALASLMENDEVWNNQRFNFAYFPALAAYMNEDWENTLKYAEIAQNDEEYGEDATEFICESYGALGDSTKWLQSLKDGLIKYPTKDYYYNKLLNYYNQKNDMAEMEAFVRDMIEVDPEKAYNYYVLGFIAQQNKEYDKAIEQYTLAIEKDGTLGEAYNNLGLCIMNKAYEKLEAASKLDYRSAAYKNAEKEHQAILREAIPYFTKLREIDPSSTKKWGVPLQQIYYNLKMTKELDEVNDRLKEAGLL